MALSSDSFKLPDGTTVEVDAASESRIIFLVTTSAGHAESFVWQPGSNQITSGVSPSQEVVDAVEEYKRRNGLEWFRRGLLILPSMKTEFFYNQWHDQKAYDQFLMAGCLSTVFWSLWSWLYHQPWSIERHHSRFGYSLSNLDPFPLDKSQQKFFNS